MDYVIQAADGAKGPSGLAVKFGAKAGQWPEFCKANPQLKAHSQYGCVYYVGNHVNIPDTWPLAQPAIPPPGPNSPAPAPGTPASPLAPAPATTAGFFGMDTKTILIGAAVVAAGVVAVYALKKKSQASPA